MMTMKQDPDEIERLKALVAVYGGDRERWPRAEQLALARLVASDQHAAEIVAEAQALDRLLDKAPALGKDRISDLTQRIVAAAQAEGRWQGETVQRGSAEIRERRAAGEVMGPQQSDRVHGWQMPARLWASRRGPLASVAMLAASLMIGVMIGMTFAAGDVATEPQTVADASDDAVFQQLVTGEDGLESLVEDLL